MDLLGGRGGAKQACHFAIAFAVRLLGECEILGVSITLAVIGGLQIRERLVGCLLCEDDGRHCESDNRERDRDDSITIEHFTHLPKAHGRIRVSKKQLSCPAEGGAPKRENTINPRSRVLSPRRPCFLWHQWLNWWQSSSFEKMPLSVLLATTHVGREHCRLPLATILDSYPAHRKSSSPLETPTADCPNLDRAEDRLPCGCREWTSGRHPVCGELLISAESAIRHTQAHGRGMSGMALEIAARRSAEKILPALNESRSDDATVK